MCKAIEVGGGFALRQWNLWNKTRMAVSEGIMKTKTTLERWGSGKGGGAGRKRVKRGEIGQQFTALTNWHAPHWDRVILNRVTCALTLGTRITLYYFVLLCNTLYSTPLSKHNLYFSLYALPTACKSVHLFFDSTSLTFRGPCIVIYSYNNTN